MNKNESLCAIEDAWKEFERCGEISNSAENLIKAAESGWKDHDALVEALEAALEIADDHPGMPDLSGLHKTLEEAKS